MRTHERVAKRPANPPSLPASPPQAPAVQPYTGDMSWVPGAMGFGWCPSSTAKHCLHHVWQEGTERLLIYSAETSSFYRWNREAVRFIPVPNVEIRAGIYNTVCAVATGELRQPTKRLLSEAFWFLKLAAVWPAAPRVNIQDTQ